MVSTAPLSSGRPDSPLLGLEVQTPLVLGLSRIFPPEYHRAAANLLSPPPGAGAGAQPSCASFVFGVGVGVLFLSCSGFLEGSEYRAALWYSFQCFMGFFVFLSDFFCLLV